MRRRSPQAVGGRAPHRGKAYSSSTRMASLGDAMPQRVMCSKCGFVLHEEEEDLRPPDEIIQMFEDERCPRCGHKLEVVPVRIELKPLKRVRRARR